MESKTKVLGHPIHPMLIVFPLGLFVTAVICDILLLITGNKIFSIAAFINISGGILGGLVAAIFGFRDYLAIPEGTRAKHIGIFHGFGNLAVVLLFSISWLTRLNVTDYRPGVFGLIFSFAAFLLAGVTGWLGGELVDRLGVGVDPGANLDAPNSLTGRSPEPAAAPRMSAIPVTGTETMTQTTTDQMRTDMDTSEDHDIVDEP